MRTKDLNGNYIYHSTNDAFQQIGGYNEIYDIIFDYVTDMQDQEFEFSSGGVAYKLWAWKGDYLNLGAGAELGIYSKKSGLFGIIGVDSPIDDHWLVDTNLAMYTTMTVKYKGEEIINWDPKKDKEFGDDKVWWATSFNPSYTNVTADDLTASFTVTFNSEEMFEDFYEAYSSEKGKPSKWTFDYVSKTATLTF